MALYESLALEGRKRMAELISACFAHAKNRVRICSSKTAHEQRMMAEVLLQFRQHLNTRAMLADFHQLYARGRLLYPDWTLVPAD
jgi:hypothetical protein